MFNISRREESQRNRLIGCWVWIKINWIMVWIVGLYKQINNYKYYKIKKNINNKHKK